MNGVEKAIYEFNLYSQDYVLKQVQSDESDIVYIYTADKPVLVGTIDEDYLHFCADVKLTYTEQKYLKKCHKAIINNVKHTYKTNIIK